MSFFDQSDYDIRCEWGLHGIDQLAPAAVIIIVDVLSFSTCVDIATSRGATVLPYRWKDERAATYAQEQNAQLAGRRSRFEGQYSLAPSSLTKVSAGLRIVLPSPNGSTLAFHAMDTGAKVVMGCLRNATAVARWASSVGGKITVVPAGERWPDNSLRPAVEDLIGAGAILRHLTGSSSPESQSAVAAFLHAQSNLPAQLLASCSGRELAERNFAADVTIAAEHDVSRTVPLLHGSAFANAGC